MEITGYKDKHEYTNKNGITSVVYLMDCMDLLKQIPDKYFELAIVDPPYGIGADKKNSTSKVQCKRSAAKSSYFGKQEWDSNIPSEQYFDLLIKSSDRKIIWGANYFGLIGGMLYWHKNVTMPTYSDGELAWLSWQNKIDYLELTWHGMLQSNMKNKENRIHPTQKPIKLYEWLIKNYAKDGDKILDTHLGSGSSRIAADKANLPFVGCELDPDYFYASVKRFNDYSQQQTIF
jgi:site-specific DNA-methyltransferase (adenine-specific)